MHAQRPETYHPANVVECTASAAQALMAHFQAGQVQVEHARKRWNALVRIHLRDVTGLRLSHQGRTQEVPVRVLSAIPESFAAQIKTLDPELLTLLLMAPDLQQAHISLAALRPQLSRAQSLVREQKRPCPPGTEAYDETAAFIEIFTNILAIKDLLQPIKVSHRDILGAYHFTGRESPRVDLYWLPIALTAKLLRVTVADLTLVVLAHELAHAYTHVGFDIEGRQWSEEKFGDTDLHVVEGLAQYYTRQVCVLVSPQAPQALAAFEALLKVQPAPYHSQQRWDEELRQKIKGELGLRPEPLRSAMLGTRHAPAGNDEDFRERLRFHHQMLPPVAGPGELILEDPTPPG